MRTATPLTSPWTLTILDPGPTVPAHIASAAAPGTGTMTGLSVPGCVHTDLLAAGLLADPYLERHEDDQHWIGQSRWSYTHVFHTDLDPGRRYALAFDGIDTMATVLLNGVELGHTANMHRRYRFDVSALLRRGDNTLEVRFDSVYEAAAKVRAELGERPNVFPEPFQYVRKMACNFGWDWGPTLVTAGLWREVRLESWEVARIDAVRPVATPGPHGGRVVVTGHVERDEAQGVMPEGGLAVRVRCAGSAVTAVVDGDQFEVVLEGLDVATWWPVGYGEQPLYELTVELIAGGSSTQGPVCDSWTRRVGFRTVEHRTDTDAAGREFVLIVNGLELFIRGVNWIPDDCFVSRVDRARYAKRLTQTRDANVTLVRVWGGGIYESDDFYDVCDELGLLVWQDFLFACSAYPEEQPLAAEVQAEARDNVERLMPHPSLVLWNGNNENIWGFSDWGWAEPLAGRTWGWGYYTELLPRVMAQIDPSRPYWPGSPYSGPDTAPAGPVHPNDPAYGNHHSWEVWNRQDYTTYRDDRPRFVSEFGFQAPANWATTSRAVSAWPCDPQDAVVRHHQKADDGNGKLARGMAGHLPEPTGADGAARGDRWHYLTQLNQTRAVSYAISWYRSLTPHCRGAIVWQINDCWPVASWSAIDGDGRCKPLWYALRDVFAPVFATLQLQDREVVIVNDEVTPVCGTLVVTRRDVDGGELAQQRTDVVVAGLGVVRIALSGEIATPGDPTRELLTSEFQVADERGRAIGKDTSIRRVRSREVLPFAEDVAMAYPEAAFELTAVPFAAGVRLTVTAQTLVRDLMVRADAIDPDAVVSDQLLTVFPGEQTTVEVTTTQAVPADVWVTALRCLNSQADGSRDAQ